MSRKSTHVKILATFLIAGLLAIPTMSCYQDSSLSNHIPITTSTQNKDMSDNTISKTSNVQSDKTIQVENTVRPTTSRSTSPSSWNGKISIQRLIGTVFSSLASDRIITSTEFGYWEQTLEGSREDSNVNLPDTNPVFYLSGSDEPITQLEYRLYAKIIQLGFQRVTLDLHDFYVTFTIADQDYIVPCSNTEPITISARKGCDSVVSLSLDLTMIASEIPSGKYTINVRPMGKISYSFLIAPRPSRATLPESFSVGIRSVISAPFDMPTEGYTYPRLALGTHFLKKWLTTINPQTGQPYGLQWLYQFQLIYAQDLTPDVYYVQQAARDDGHADWVENTTFICNTCPTGTWDYSTTPPDSNYELAINCPQYAIPIAVYENKIRGCDWFMRDIHGDLISLWGGTWSYATDSTPNCDRGLWDGKFMVNGHQYDIGDTRGKTVAEWMCSGLRDNVLYGSSFATTFDGMQAEDWPSGWVYTYLGQIPDPLHNGMGMDSTALENYCKDTWNYITINLWGDMARHGYITRINDNSFRWLAQGFENPWPAVQESFSGCKFEDLGKWGGWPHYDMLSFWQCYNWLEPYYHPLEQTKENDTKQGWDVSTMQINAENQWSLANRQKWKRMGLAFTLMGNGSADVYANSDDFFFYNFLNSGSIENAPEGIPELSIKLGKAWGPYETHYNTSFPTKPLYYRQFYNADNQQTYTVVVNIHDVTIQGIPDKDGKWFEGNWPDGPYQAL